jgi:MFS family permease
MQQTDSTTRRPGVVLALVCLPVFIGALDLTIVSAFLPEVMVDLRLPFQTAADDASWVVSGYLLAYTLSVAMMGRISDLIGRRRTYFIALLLFILGSWLVAVASFVPAGWVRTIFRTIQGGRPDQAFMSLYALIGGRVIQALGAGAMVPVSMALVGDLYPPEHRATALGVVGAVDTAGWVLGHLYGGLMVQVVDWPVLFWINIPITTLIAIVTWWQLRRIATSYGEGGLKTPAIITVLIGVGVINLLALVALSRAVTPYILDTFTNRLLGIKWLTNLTALVTLAAIILTLTGSRRIGEHSRADWPGTILLAVVLIGLNLGLGGNGGEITLSGDFAESPTFTPMSIAALVITGVALIGFILAERHSKHPLFALSHFRRRNISLASIINLLVGFCLMVGLVSVPLFINMVVATDLSEAALLSGILLGTLTVPMAISSIPGGILTALGLLLASVGFFLGRTWTPDVTRTTMGLHMALAGIGLGLTVAPIGTAVINLVKADERGIASAVVLVMRLVGMTLGTSIMTNYGLRRSNILTAQLLAGLGDSPDITALIDTAIRVATMVINEMLLIAALICLAAAIPALFMRPRDTWQEPASNV